MITGALKSKVDNIWNTMWSGGISNPLSVIEQLTYQEIGRPAARPRRAPRPSQPGRDARRNPPAGQSPSSCNS